MFELLIKTAVASWEVLGEMSPYLLFGFLVAGLLSVCFSPAWIEKHLGGKGYGPVVKASLLGVPLPLCSCGVIPVSASIRRHGASPGAVASFLLSTPQTGVDSIAATWSLLGPVFAVFRPIVAFLTGLVGGGLVYLFGEKDTSDDSPTQNYTHAHSDNGTTAAHGCGEACCSTKKSENRIVHVFRYGFLTLPRDIGGALVVGVFVAGAITAFVPAQELQKYVGPGIGSILLAMAVGIPLYVCATASVPIAAGLIYAGASPGAALAFLIAGPATNAATIGVTWRLLGKRSTIIYLLTIAVSAVGSGLLLNALMASLPIVPEVICHHHGEAGLASHLWGAALLVVLFASYFWPAANSTDTEAFSAENNEATPREIDMEPLELNISGMTCSHCAATVERTLKEFPGVRDVHVSLAEGKATIRGERLVKEKLSAAIKELGYEVK